jgi:hypothetical protein
VFGIDSPSGYNKRHHQKHIEKNRWIDVPFDFDQTLPVISCESMFLDVFFYADPDPNKIKNNECFGKKIKDDGQDGKGGMIGFKNFKTKVALKAACKKHKECDSRQCVA